MLCTTFHVAILPVLVVSSVFARRNGLSRELRPNFKGTQRDFDDVFTGNQIDSPRFTKFTGLGSHQSVDFTRRGQRPSYTDSNSLFKDRMIKSVPKPFVNHHHPGYGHGSSAYFHKPIPPNKFLDHGLSYKRPSSKKMRFPTHHQSLWKLEQDQNFGRFTEPKGKFRDQYKLHYFGGKRPTKGKYRDHYYGSTRLYKTPFRSPKYRSKYYHHYYSHYHPTMYNYDHFYHYYPSLPPWYLHLLMLLESHLERYGHFDPYYDPFFFWPIWLRPYTTGSSSSGAFSRYPMNGYSDKFKKYRKKF